jgi:hypothetical protein
MGAPIPGPVDLHSHTTASDGELAPATLVAQAARGGLRVLAITDHDSTEGLAEATAEAARWAPLQIVPGIEINCDVESAEIHVLGYLMDHEAPWFRDFCRAQREERRARIHRILDRLATLGMPLEADEVWALVREGAAGRPHVAQAMVARGYVRSVRQAFERFLARGRPAYVPRKALEPVEAVRIIRRAGGVPVLAHPGLSGRDDIIPELVAAGLMGIECYYTEHSAAQTATYVDLCRRYGLVTTGGSDFHGPRVRPATLGVPHVPLAVWHALEAKAAEARASRPREAG